MMKEKQRQVVRDAVKFTNKQSISIGGMGPIKIDSHIKHDNSMAIGNDSVGIDSSFKKT